MTTSTSCSALSPADTGASRMLEKALAHAADAGWRSRQGSENERQGRGQALRQRKEHGKGRAKLAESRKRHAGAQGKLASDLMALPAAVKELIPASTPEITIGQIEAAKRIVDERQGQLDDLRHDRDRRQADLRSSPRHNDSATSGAAAKSPPAPGARDLPGALAGRDRAGRHRPGRRPAT